uniref:Uncharacterized protein n=1 Tax=Candidatus Kentrum sp. FM TaxID=2126340 RepID=A0A450SPD6_9GAMM|nr:MAG: hypothetical protein BECKFM1743A_GA0114220_1013710 [Candidatus Kentron sp. FM]VFJ55685.1 MAG: hypothetical protein BECKFM1743C_GA0114222_101629 [Candidatus Kentron sp. FM]VFK10780.1 MAG: hypothetical protein BECKFM1743B_GA0114221_101549 [Candidatus Kentron sp. FM]
MAQETCGEFADEFPIHHEKIASDPQITEAVRKSFCDAFEIDCLGAQDRWGCARGLMRERKLQGKSIGTVPEERFGYVCAISELKRSLQSGIQSKRLMTDAQFERFFMRLGILPAERRAEMVRRSLSTLPMPDAPIMWLFRNEDNRLYRKRSGRPYESVRCGLTPPDFR